MRRQTEELIRELKNSGIEIYIVSDADPHLSEYVSDHYKALEEFSGFTGGDGKLVCTADGRAYLWTDGRYFIQAEEELHGSGIELVRMGEPDVPELSDWIKAELSSEGVLGFDGRLFSFNEGEKLEEAADGRIVSRDLCGSLWRDRPELKITDCYMPDEALFGLSTAEKLSKIRESITESGANAHIIASLDDIAWILNMRASDISYNPVFYAYMIINAKAAVLYTDERHFKNDRSLKEKLYKQGVLTRAYEHVFEDVAKLSGRLLADPSRCSFELISRCNDDTELIFEMNPSAGIKCLKNPVERANLKKAQHRDNTAVTRFIYWFKKNIGHDQMTECSVADRLHQFRMEEDGFISESFETISAYGPNAAMAHYAPSRERDVIIEPRGLYLVDSGGQYICGTTDITRTISCGPITDEEKRDFTLTVIANLRLAAAVFPEGTSGLCVDYAARKEFWDRSLNYNHGTGHGVGFLLNVHEAPAAIRYRTETVEGISPLLEGMYISDEPGMYVEGKYGIRTENLLMVRCKETNEYGHFMCFETMTLVPIDKTCLDLKLMSANDIDLLNAYHEKVLKDLEPEFTGEELEWLKSACAPI